MTDDDTRALLRELANETDGSTDRDRSPEDLSGDEAQTYDLGEVFSPEATELDRSFASEYLDELIIALLLRHDEMNGMDIIREFANRFGVQFSPGTVYPHLHSLEEEGILACRECVQTKEYRIVDARAARSYVESRLTQLSAMLQFLGPPLDDAEQADRNQERPEQ